MSKFEVKEAQSKLVTGYYYEGEAILFQHNGKQSILLAPDKETLRDAYRQFGPGSFDESKCKHVITSGAQNFAPVTLPTISEMINDDFKEYWFYWPGSNTAQFGMTRWANNSNNDHVKLGLAERRTTIECKLLLRSYGMKREDIEKVKILDDDIPF